MDVVFVEEERITAELVNADLKRDAGARRSLGENERPSLSGEHRRNMPTALGLEFPGERKDLAQFMGLEVGFLEEVFHRLKRKT